MTDTIYIKCSIPSCSKRIHGNNVICSYCIKYNLYIHSVCIETFELNISNLNTIDRYINSDSSIYYLRDDILNLIMKINNLTKKDCSRDIKEKLRREELMRNLREYKLEYKKHGICDAYIKFGSPDLRTVIQTLRNKLSDNRERIIELIDRLSDHIQIDETHIITKIPSFNRYIEKGGDIEDVINDGLIEFFLYKETNYKTLLMKYTNEEAKDIALSQYISSDNIPDIIVPHIAIDSKLRFD